MMDWKTELNLIITSEAFKEVYIEDFTEDVRDNVIDFILNNYDPFLTYSKASREEMKNIYKLMPLDTLENVYYRVFLEMTDKALNSVNN